MYCSDVLESEGASLTVTEHVADLEPSTVVAVIVAEPVVTPRTTPSVTVATEVLDDCQLTALFVALDGNTVGTICD